MSDPTLYREKLLKPAVLLLGKGADQEDETLRVLSLRALGSMALGAPKKVPPPLPPSLEARGAGCGARSPGPGAGACLSPGMGCQPRGGWPTRPVPPQVRQYRKLLLEKCLCALREPGGTGVPSEGMEALARILAELREGDLGSSFDAISEQCRAFFDNVSADESLAGPSAGGPQMPAQRARARLRALWKSRTPVPPGTDGWPWDLVKKERKKKLVRGLRPLLPAVRG